jgi:hypothetical protein
MVALPRRSTRSASSEEGIAATRLILGLSIAVGGMAGGIGLVSGQGMGWLTIPSVAIVAALFLRATPHAGWAATVVWAGLLPEAHAEAMLGPLFMIVACVAIALGPARLLALLRRDVEGRPADRPPDGAWIEEA